MSRDISEDGHWSDWGSWSLCSKSCGWGGIRQRIRACDNPPPGHGGQPCAGSDKEVDNTCADVQCDTGRNILHKGSITKLETDK